jgi:hypothetical protein
MSEHDTSNEPVPSNDQSAEQKKKPYRSKAELSPAQIVELDRRERILLPFALRQIQRKQDVPSEVKERICAQVPDAVESLDVHDFNADKAITEYGRAHRQFYIKLAEYVVRMIQYPDDHECWSECLGENRGRPQGASHVVTKKHRIATQAGIVIRERTGIHSDGTESVVTLQPGIDVLADVHEFGLGVIDHYQSTSTTRREVQRIMEENPSLIKLITEDEHALRRDAKPKIQFQVDETDALWCWDFCDLPNYFNDNGIIATGVLLLLIEVKLDVKLHIKVLLKKVEDEEGNTLPRTFKTEDAAKFAATAMYIHNRRPKFFYNDRDPRFRSLGNFYAHLTEPGETPISTFSPPTEEPWARGLLEGSFQRQLHKFAKRFTGYYNKRNRRTIKKAIEKPEKLPTTTLYENDLRAYLEDINTMPRPRRVRSDKNPQASRAALYSSSINPRPCPPVRRLFHLPIEKCEDWVVLDDNGFNFAKGGEEHFIPIVETEDELPDLYERWMNATLSKKKVHLYAVELEIGWVGEIHLEDKWYAIVARSEYPFTHFEDDRQFDIVVARLKQKQVQFEESTLNAFREHFGSLPQRLNQTYRGQYVQPKNAIDPQGNNQSSQTPASESSPKQPNSPPRRSRTQTATRPTPSRQDEVDWSDLF